MIKYFWYAQDATSLYRKILSAQPDTSVVIISIELTTNSKNLIISKPDSYSSLNGLSLISKKVKMLSMMGGHFPSGKKEWNFAGDAKATKIIIDNWPTPIIFSGSEIGENIKTGRILSDKTPINNPVRKSFELFDENFWPILDKKYKLTDGIHPHNSYDQTSVIVVFRPPQNYWNIIHNGYCECSPDGSNCWKTTSVKKHSFLVEKISPNRVGKIIDSLMIVPVLKIKM